MLHITALMDNLPSGNRALVAEHGLSLLLDFNGRRILFDCGADPGFLHNARKLGIDLDPLDAVILSHSHYDHAAGFRDLVEGGYSCPVLYTGPGFFDRKYARKGCLYSDLSGGFGPDFLAAHGIVRQEVDGITELFPGLYLIGGFPRVHNFEKIPGRFVRRQGGQFLPDDFRDEICIAAEVTGGLILLVGCSHPGIVNMVTHVRSLLGKPIAAVFGGTHLKEADTAQISATIDALKEAGIRLLGLSHCSGSQAEEAIALREDVQGCHLGTGDCVFFD